MAGEVLQGVGTIMSGRANARAAVTEAALAERQAKDVDLQSLQVSERRREDLRAAMASVEAQRAAKGLSLDSPSAIAIEKELSRQAVRDENVQRLGFLNQSDAYRMSAKAKRKGASNIMTASYLSAAGTVWSGAQNAAAAGAK